MRITYSACPSCLSKEIAWVLNAKDHTVSSEQYEIWECASCALRFTQNVPPPEEIGKYYQSENYISHSDNKKGLVNTLYHTVRRRTLSRKRSLIESFGDITAGNLLDVGAGTGAFLNTMAEAGWAVKGLEPDDIARKNAKELYKIDLDAPEKLFESPSQHFDVITMWHVLEHVHNLHGYMQQLNQLLKSNGNLYIAVPNYTSYDADVYKSAWAAYDVPRHLYHFSPRSMKNLLQQHGFELKAMKPMWYDSFYVSMLSQQYKKGHGNVSAAGLNGLVSNLKTVFNVERCSSIIYIAGKEGVKTT